MDGALHPGDVKPALARHINVILQPVRDHFVNNKEAKALLDTIKKYHKDFNHIRAIEFNFIDRMLKTVQDHLQGDIR